MSIVKIARAVSGPLLGLGLFVIAIAFFATFMAVRLHLDGYSDTIVGVVGGSFWAGIIVGTLLTERLISRVGHIRAYAVFASALTAAMMAQALAPPPWPWIPLRVLAGFCTSGLYVVIESWLLEGSTNKTRGQVLAVYMITLYAAQCAGQFVIKMTDPQSLLPFCAPVILTALSIVPVCMTRGASPTPHLTRFLGLVRIYRTAPVGVICCLGSGMILGSVYSLLPVYVQDAGLGLNMVAWVMGTVIMGGLLLQWPIGRLSDLIDRRATIALVSLVTAALACMLLFAGRLTMPLQLLLFAVFGGFSFTLYPLSISHSCDRTQGVSIVSTTATLLLIYGIGAMSGPMLAPLLGQVVGQLAIPFFIAGVALLLTVYTAWRMLAREPVPVSEQVEFVGVPRTGILSSRLDPRARPKAEEESPPEAEGLEEPAPEHPG